MNKRQEACMLSGIGSKTSDAANLLGARVAKSGMSSFGRRARIPYAKPLFGAVVLEPFHLGEPQLRRDTHRGLVGGLGGEHHRHARICVGEPVEGGCARLGGVSASPHLRQEHVAELVLTAFWTDVTLTLRVAPIERDHADRCSVELDHEEAEALPGHLGQRAVELVTRSGPADVGAHQANRSISAARSRASDWRSTSRSVMIGAGGQATGCTVFSFDMV